MKCDLQKQTILIVDDTPENIDILIGILKSEYNLKVAMGGENALKIAGSEEPPSLILLDIMMSGMDGYEICRRLKNNKATMKIPVIFVTAREDTTDEAMGFEIGAVDYITKPVSHPIVKARVKTHLALYDQNMALEKKVELRTTQLKKSFDQIKTASLETIYCLSRAAEFKDEDTASHIMRMSNYSGAIARRMGMSGDEVESILYAAPLHDVGKIGIPDCILLKPGQLTANEWDTMKQHPSIGARILGGSNTEYIKLGEVIALTHHEKWDGSGYPNGLKGNDIPQIGRIVALADFFDALTSKRPYKEAFSLEKSYAIIKENRGSHFDPAVVDAFFDAEKEILDIKQKFTDNAESIFFQIAGMNLNNNSLIN